MVTGPAARVVDGRRRERLNIDGTLRAAGNRHEESKALSGTPDVSTAAPAPGSPRHPIISGLDSVRDRFGFPGVVDPAAGSGRPVFVLSAGWRTGSTLLQRLLMSSGMLVWGEPYDNCAAIRSLAQMFAPFDAEWPADAWIVRSRDDVATDRWVANRYPDPSDFVAAHRAFLDRLFAEPAARAGFPRWGIKTVRLGGEHAAYLKALYPDARVVFLVRNPYDAFLSYRLLHDVRTSSYWWYYRWPDKPVSTARQFGLVWHDLVRSFHELAPQLGALIISFEALAAGTAFEVLEDFVDAALERSILDTRLGSSMAQRQAPTAAQSRLTTEEQWDLRDSVDPLARELGYLRPTTPA